MKAKDISKKVFDFTWKSLLGGVIAGSVGLSAVSLSTGVSPQRMFWNYALSFPKDEVVIEAQRGHTLWGYGWQIRNTCFKDPLGLRGTIGPEVRDVTKVIYDSNPKAFTEGLREGDYVRVPVLCNRQISLNVPPGVENERSLYRKK